MAPAQFIYFVIIISDASMCKYHFIVVIVKLILIALYTVGLIYNNASCLISSLFALNVKS